MKVLKNKSTGTDVKILQIYLNIDVDGKFGKQTAAALNIWKKELGLNQNGIMEETDWVILAKSLPTIKQGDKNKYVTMWQTYLGIEADGVFGAQTKASTRAFQTSIDGIANGVVSASVWLAAFTKEPAPVQASIQPVNYKQYDSRWGSVIYTKNNTYNKKQTIKNSGCGPTSMADIVATWWDNKVTPKTLAALSVANGYRTTNSGTAWGFFQFCANKYGASKYVKTTSIATLKEALQHGAYAVVSFAPSKWTKGGHFCCIWKWDGTYFYINDPASASAARAKGTEKEVLAARKQFFIFYK